MVIPRGWVGPTPPERYRPSGPLSGRFLDARDTRRPPTGSVQPEWIRGEQGSASGVPASSREGETSRGSRGAVNAGS